MLALILWGGIFAYLFYHYAIKPMSYWKNRGIPQGNPRWLLGDNLGTTFKRQSFAELVKEVYDRYKDRRYSGIYQLTVPTLVIHDSDLLKQITVKDFDHFTDHRSFVPETADPLWAKNLFALTGQRWKDMRPILSPSFTSSKMKSIFTLMSESVDVFIKHFTKDDKELVEAEMKDIFTRFGNDVIASSAFGIQVDSLAHPKNEFYMMGKDATDFGGFWKNIKFLGYLIIPKIYNFFKITLFSKEVSKFFCGIVNETIKTREEKNIVRPDMIHLLMEARKGKNKHEENGMVETGFATVQEIGHTDKGNSNKHVEITNMDIAAQAMIFFFAGFDSVTTLMCFMAYELALHPDIQDRLRREIVETDASCKGKLTYEALMKMKYMDMVVSESLRKWPNAVAVDRVCTKPYTIEPTRPDEEPLHLEKGDVLWIPIYGFHKDPDRYPEPDRFDPERFNDENKGNIDPYAYMPFGLGPRNCIGSRFALLEIKTLFYHLMLNFELVPTKKTPIPPVISKRSFNLSIEGGFNLGLKRIKK